METTIMENQMEKKMENEMEYIGVYWGNIQTSGGGFLPGPPK